MNIDRKQLISLLLRMDVDQRIKGLLFELHFEKYICPSMIRRKPAAGFTTGWITGEHDGKPVALKNVSDGLSSIDKKFIDHVSRKGWKTGLFKFNGKSFVATSDAEGWLKAGCERANAEFEKFCGKKETIIQDRVSAYLDAIDETVLYAGFTARASMNCLMNANVVSNIRDLDAVFFSEDKGLSIVEFKRKDPMKSFRPWRDDKNPNPITLDVLNDIESFVETDRRPGRHFGLDINSHVKTVVDARAAGMRYLYLILESKETFPDEFFDIDLQALYRTPLCISEITPESFRGITETKGVHHSKNAPRRAQSGSFNSRRRIQLTVDSADFRPFDIFSPQDEIESR